MIEFQVVQRSVEVSEVLGYTAQVLQYRDNVGENISTPWMDVCEVSGASPEESKDTTVATQQARIDELLAKLAAAQAEVERLKEALTPSGETKAAYWGSDELPNIEWTYIKHLMRLIKHRAQQHREGENDE